MVRFHQATVSAQPVPNNGLELSFKQQTYYGLPFAYVSSGRQVDVLCHPAKGVTWSSKPSTATCVWPHQEHIQASKTLLPPPSAKGQRCASGASPQEGSALEKAMQQATFPFEQVVTQGALTAAHAAAAAVLVAAGTSLVSKRPIPWAAVAGWGAPVASGLGFYQAGKMKLQHEESARVADLLAWGEQHGKQPLSASAVLTLAALRKKVVSEGQGASLKTFDYVTAQVAQADSADVALAQLLTPVGSLPEKVAMKIHQKTGTLTAGDFGRR